MQKVRVANLHPEGLDRQTADALGREVRFNYEDAPGGPGESYYYVRVIQTNEQMAWSSPIWVRK